MSVPMTIVPRHRVGLDDAVEERRKTLQELDELTYQARIGLSNLESEIKYQRIILSRLVEQIFSEEKALREISLNLSDARTMWRGLETGFDRESAASLQSLVKSKGRLARNEEVRAYEIIDRVAKTFGVLPSQVKAKHNRGEAREATRAAVFLIRQVLKWSYPRIADFFDYAHHASIVDIMRKVERSKRTMDLLAEYANAEKAND